MAISYANVQVTKVLTLRGNTIQNNRYTGLPGELTVDTEAKTIRIHDGVTPGGNVVQGGGSASSYANANVKVYLTQFDGNIVPSANAVYSLGNSTTWWKDLWLSENTLYIGGVPIGSSGGSLTFGGNVVGTSDLPSYTGPISANAISVGSTIVGNITTLPKVSIAGTSGNITAGNISTTGELITGGDISTPGNISTTGGFTASDLSFKLSAAGAVIELSATNFKGSGYVPGRIYETATDGPGTGLRVMVVDVEYGPGSYASIGSPADGAVKIIDPGSGYTNGGLVYLSIRYPGESGTNALLTVYTQVNPVTYGTITANTSVWSFDESGNTTVPGDILLPDNTAIYNVDANTAVFTTNSISDATSIYLTDSGNAAVYASDSVVLETNSDGNVSQQWAFNQNGNVVFPDNTTQSTAFSNTAPIIITLSSNITAANVGLKGYVDLANTIQSAQVNAANLAITAANVGMKGYVDSVASQSIYGNANVAAYLPTFSGNISAGNVSALGNVTADYFIGPLGSITNLDSLNFSVENISARIAENGVNIGAGGYNNLLVLPTDVLIQNVPLTVAGNIIANEFTGLYITANLPIGGTAQIWNFGADGRLTFPGTPRIDTDSNNFEVQAAESINFEANAVVNIYTDTSGTAYQWQFGDSGDLSVPGDVQFADGSIITDNLEATGDFGISTAANVGFMVETNDGSHTWLFDDDGRLTFPGTPVIDTDANNFDVIGAESVSLEANAAVNIYTDTGGSAYQWQFGNDGNLTLPNVASVSINYANGVSILSGLGGGGGDYGNVEVAAYLNTQGYNLYSNVNVAAYLSTATINTTGNITAQNLIGNISITGNVTGTSANVTLQAGAYTSVFDNQGNVRLPTAYVTGNVTANYFVGNGALLTGIVSGSNYSNVQVATYLPTYTGNVANIRLGVAGVLTFADSTLQTTAWTGTVSGGSVSGNVAEASLAYAVNISPVLLNQEYSMAILPTSSGAYGVKSSDGTTAFTFNPSRNRLIVGNIQIAVDGNIRFADGTILTSAAAIAGSNYGNGNVASYLITSGYVNTNSAYGNGNVLSYLTTNQYINANSAYSNANVTSYLPTYSGNVGVNNIIGTTPNVTLVANSYSTTFDIYGNVAFGNVIYPVQVFVTGNVSAGNVLVPGTSGKIGFSGGNFVQQATSNSTQVTSHFTSGNIQLMNINLGISSAHTVTFSCNKLTTNDMLVVKHIGGGLTSVYVDAYVVSDGLAIIWMRNISGIDTGSFTPMLKYAIIRAPSA